MSTTPKKPRPLNKTLVKDSIIACRGNIWRIAARLNRTRSTIYSFIDRHPDLQELLEDARETRLDIGEAALDEAVAKGQGWAVCFLLKTIGKKRGYVEQQKDPALPPLEVVLNALPESLRAAVIDAITESLQRSNKKSEE